MPEHEFVTCKDCPDFDLCFLCISGSEHGHHPGHEFEPVAKDASKMTSRITNLCNVGRGSAHNAICDGCDKVGSISHSMKHIPLLTGETEHHRCATQVSELP